MKTVRREYLAESARKLYKKAEFHLQMCFWSHFYNLFPYRGDESEKDLSVYK